MLQVFGWFVELCISYCDKHNINSKSNCLLLCDLFLFVLFGLFTFLLFAT